MDLFGRLGLVIDHVEGMSETYRSTTVQPDNDPACPGRQAETWLQKTESLWNSPLNNLKDPQSTEMTLGSEWFQAIVSHIQQTPFAAERLAELE